MASIPGIPVAVIVSGGILVWSGVYNQSLTNTLGSILTGQKPSPGPQVVNQVSGAPAGAPGASSSTVANTALKYAGSRYVWGGAPGTAAGVDQGTDCSGFVNMVVGRDLGLAIPGYGAGKYNGSTHGPTTLSYLGWGGVPGITRAQLQAGDLVVWQTHMGIALGGDQMISALDTQDGVKVTSIENGSPTGEVLFCKRLAVQPNTSASNPYAGGITGRA